MGSKGLNISLLSGELSMSMTPLLEPLIFSKEGKTEIVKSSA